MNSRSTGQEQKKPTTKTRKNQEPLKAHTSVGSSHSLQFYDSPFFFLFFFFALFPKAPFFSPLLLPVPSPPPCHLPLAGEAAVPEAQREGRRSPPAWPGATRTASCQESSVSCCPPQGNPNKVTSPPESILPFKERLCVEPRTCIYGLIEISPNLLRTQSASKGPTQAHLLLLSGADLAWVLNKLWSY